MFRYSAQLQCAGRVFRYSAQCVNTAVQFTCIVQVMCRYSADSVQVQCVISVQVQCKCSILWYSVQLQYACSVQIQCGSTVYQYNMQVQCSGKVCRHSAHVLYRYSTRYSTRAFPLTSVSYLGEEPGLPGARCCRERCPPGGNRLANCRDGGCTVYSVQCTVYSVQF